MRQDDLTWREKLTFSELSLPRGIQTDKNLAIANRSRVSCAHNTLRAFVGLNITPLP